MSKIGLGYSIVASILSAVTVAGTVAMCVPESQTAIADYTAENLSPKYQASVELTKELKNQISDLRFNVENLNNLLETTQGKLDQANSKISNLESTLLAKNNLLSEKDTQNKALQGEITSLQEQITTLQNNIETLEQEKQSLQEQITQLNTQKAELEQQVADLQSRIAELENSLNITVDFTTYRLPFGINVYSDDLGKECLFPMSVYSLNQFATISDVFIDVIDDVTLKYNGREGHGTILNEGLVYNCANCVFYKDGVLLEDFNDFCSNHSFDEKFQCKVIFNLIDGIFSTRIDIVTTPILSGSYVCSEGYIIDFDNLNFTDSSISFNEGDNIFVENCHGGKYLYIGDNVYDLTFEENDSLCLNGCQYYKIDFSSEEEIELSGFYVAERYDLLYFDFDNNKMRYENDVSSFGSVLCYVSGNTHILKFTANENDFYIFNYIDNTSFMFSDLTFTKIDENISLSEFAGTYKDVNLDCPKSVGEQLLTVSLSSEGVLRFNIDNDYATFTDTYNCLGVICLPESNVSTYFFKNNSNNVISVFFNNSRLYFTYGQITELGFSDSGWSLFLCN